MGTNEKMINVRVPAKLHREFMKKCRMIDTDGSKNLRAYMREFVSPEKVKT
jgi:hypothetical protein